MLKRTFDFMGALVGILVLTPVFAVTAVLVACDSKGGIFYKQERVGLKGELFKLLKFRTMHVQADRGTAITVGNRDPRITRVGYYLRKYKVDELPQLINVIIGDMSIVGPRPELKRFVDLYSTEQLVVLTVRPGITDLASIKYRHENEMLAGKEDPITFYIDEIMPAKLQLNLDYIERKSIWLDVKIIFLTFLSIFRRS